MKKLVGSFIVVWALLSGSGQAACDSAVDKTKGGHFEVRPWRGYECAETYDRADRRLSVTCPFEQQF